MADSLEPLEPRLALLCVRAAIRVLMLYLLQQRLLVALPAQNASRFSTFPMFVPSLSWQNACLCISMAQKKAFFAPLFEQRVDVHQLARVVFLVNADNLLLDRLDIHLLVLLLDIV